MAGVVGLIDRAVGLPPGPELSAVLAELSWAAIPNVRLVEVVQARSRQLAHEQAELLAGLVEIAHAVPVGGLPVDAPGAVVRAPEPFEWASHEIAAGLTWTPTAADRELAFAFTLVRELPLVFAALQAGAIDRNKAWVLAQHLDPARGELSAVQIRRLCERFVPLAAGLTTRQLVGRLVRAIIAIDPDYHRRRYRRAVAERGVALHLDRDGTATVSGQGLAPVEAAAAAARLDRLAAAAKRAGHPGRLGQISADLYLGMLDGSFHGLTEAQILARLLTGPRPEDTVADADAAADDVDDAAGAAAVDGVDPGVDPEAGEHDSDSDSADDDRPAPVEGACGANATCDDAPPAGCDFESDVRSAERWAERWAGERVGIREGVEIRVGLATVLGLDERPGEIAGLGAVDAEVARRGVAGQRRGARWQFAVVDAEGHLLLAGPLRRRRRPGRGRPGRPGRAGRVGVGLSGRVRGGVVELHLTVAELARLAAEPGLTGGWARVVAEIAAAWACRHRLREGLARDPHARFARGALARHVQIRDRSCCGPGCTRPARRSDLDHTAEHARGGATVEGNLGPGCWRHHPDKDRGWTLTQPEPGRFAWTSPLGRVYRTRGEPIRADLPDPDPPPAGTDHRDDPDTRHDQRRPEVRLLWRPAKNPARPPPPAAPTVENDEPPF